MPTYAGLAYADGDLSKIYTASSTDKAVEISEGQRRQMAHQAAIYRTDEAGDQCCSAYLSIPRPS